MPHWGHLARGHRDAMRRAVLLLCLCALLSIGSAQDAPSASSTQPPPLITANVRAAGRWTEERGGKGEGTGNGEGKSGGGTALGLRRSPSATVPATGPKTRRDGRLCKAARQTRGLREKRERGGLKERKVMDERTIVISVSLSLSLSLSLSSLTLTPSNPLAHRAAAPDALLAAAVVRRCARHLRPRGEHRHGHSRVRRSLRCVLLHRPAALLYSSALRMRVPAAPAWLRVGGCAGQDGWLLCGRSRRSLPPC